MVIEARAEGLNDFGIARSSAEPAMTGTGLILGSPAYLAPEVAKGTPIATVASVVKDPVPAHPHAGRLGKVISGLLLKTPNLRMRLDRASPILRAVADDPSGTHLTAVERNRWSPPQDAARLGA